MLKLLPSPRSYRAPSDPRHNDAWTERRPWLLAPKRIRWNFTRWLITQTDTLCWTCPMITSTAAARPKEGRPAHTVATLCGEHKRLLVRATGSSCAHESAHCAAVLTSLLRDAEDFLCGWLYCGWTIIQSVTKAFLLVDGGGLAIPRHLLELYRQCKRTKPRCWFSFILCFIKL